MMAWQSFGVSPADRARLMGQNPCVLWFTGLSGAGKSAIADMTDRALYARGLRSFVLDGDNVRHGLNRDLAFGPKDRSENIRRIAEVAKLLTESGLVVLVTAISPFARDRRMAKGLFPAGSFFEIFVDTPLTECIKRDKKGLYKKALEGKIQDMTGINSPYERPQTPDLTLDGKNGLPEELAKKVLALSLGFITSSFG